LDFLFTLGRLVVAVTKGAAKVDGLEGYGSCDGEDGEEERATL
jgi:hypothetical protein